MPAVFLLTLSRKLGSQKLHGSHRGNQSVNVVLRKISTRAKHSNMRICGSLDKCDSHAKAPITVDMSRQRSQLSRQNLNSEEHQSTTKQTNMSTRVTTYSVDLPAPLAPTIAILESRPTSILMPLRMSLSGVYPNVTSDICSRGGEILSVSGNLKSISKALRKEEGKTKILELFGFLLFRRFQVRKLSMAPLSL